MNTPDTEWEKEFERKFVKTIPVTKERLVQDTERRLKNFIRSLLAEREAESDTYWKERVRKEVETIMKLEIGEMSPTRIALDTLLDNLK